ncbi:MAG: DNA primase [Solobacterium sp.]|nr:DNA primase [Solobacterium sp.]
MVLIPKEEIQAVRQKADIADIIGRYIPVQKRGREFVAVCPFHDDHDPSLHISTSRQFYKCFVCGAGGSVFTFVENYEHVNFPEAVIKVAELIGYPLSVTDTGTKQETAQENVRGFRVLNEAVRFTSYELNSEDGTEARAYLDQRGLNQEIREKFGIGYNPPGDRLTRFLQAKGFEDGELVEVNVSRTGVNGLSDVFSGRIMFPIHDRSGNPIGFSARTMDPENPRKYINSTETVLFHKGEIVYNAHRASLSARREAKIYLCEGVTDVIAFSQAGIDNAVCTLGTACTRSQIQLLRRLAPRIVFCYDGDNAGQNATMKAGRLAREEGCQVSVIDNRVKLDPDEILRQNGPEGLRKLVSAEMTWMEFVLKYLKERTNFDNYQEKKEFVLKAKEEIETLEDEMDRRYFTNELSKISGFTIDYVPRAQRTSVINSPGNPIQNGTVSAEEQILAMMLGHKEAAQRFSETLGFLQDSVRGAVAMQIVDAYRTADTIDVSDLIDKTATQEEKNLITKLINRWEYIQPYDRSYLDGAIRKVNISIKTALAEQYKEQLGQAMNQESTRTLMEEYRRCLNDLRRCILDDEK